MSKEQEELLIPEEVWSVWSPLIDKVRPAARVAPQDLHRTLSAIFWRHRNGAKWRSIPSALGEWWRAAQLFIRWSRLGVWERLLALVQERGLALGMVFLDGTNIRAHHKAAGAKKRGFAARSETIVKHLAALAAAMARRSLPLWTEGAV